MEENEYHRLDEVKLLNKSEYVMLFTNYKNENKLIWFKDCEKQWAAVYLAWEIDEIPVLISSRFVVSNESIYQVHCLTPSFCSIFQLNSETGEEISKLKFRYSEMEEGNSMYELANQEGLNILVIDIFCIIL